jgi:RND family efflux transporter MFP subunit
MKHVLTAILAALALSGCEAEKAPEPQGLHKVVVMTVAPVPTENLVFAGSIAPQIKTDKAFRFPGRVTSVDVAAGDRVKAGDVLATIDPTALQLEMKAAQAQFQAAEAQLDNMRSMNARQTELVKLGVTPPAAQEGSEGNLAAAESNWKSAQANLDKARNQLDDASLRADYDGIVLATAVEAGQNVAPGTTVVTIAKPEERDAVIDVPESYAPRMTDDKRFKVARTLDPTVTVEGRIREIAPNSDNTTHTLRVYVSIGEAPVDFRIGSTIEARMLDDAGLKILVPKTSLIVEGAKTHVFAFDRKAGTVVKREVTVRDWEDGFTEVTAGLKAGDEIVVAGVHSLKDNQAVQPMTDK